MGPTAEAGARIGARVIDAVIEVILVIVAFAIVPGRRWPAALFLTAVLIALYETLCTIAVGATPGKLMLGLRVAELDHAGNPSARAAFSRSLTAAVCSTVVVAGWAIGLLSTLMSPLRRGFPDRVGRTIVVRRTAQLPISTASLPGYADAAITPRMTRWGRVATLEDRRRARARRLADAPVLVLAIIVLAGTAGLPVAKLSVIIITSALWVAVFVVDETWRIARLGATAGHRQAGLVVRDTQTGEPPSPGRSFARALVLGLLLYVPPLWPITAISILVILTSDTGRGLHDLAGRTIVVADPHLDPEEQRQMSMALRLGRTT